MLFKVTKTWIKSVVFCNHINIQFNIISILFKYVLPVTKGSTKTLLVNNSKISCGTLLFSNTNLEINLF